VKLDNASMVDKLAIRRHTLAAAGLKTLRVLDLCAGEGRIWTAMKRDGYQLDHYTPVDREPRLAGTIRAEITEDLVAAIEVHRYNVVDVDTYGEPFEIASWVAPRIRQRTALFLTCGTVRNKTPGGASLSGYLRRAIGIPPSWKIPKSNVLREFAYGHGLYACCRSVKILQADRIRLSDVTYYGLAVEPRE
jgi:hypothetical protein